MREKVRKRYDPAELRTFTELLKETSDRKIQGQIYAKIREITNCPINEIAKLPGVFHSSGTIAARLIEFRGKIVHRKNGKCPVETPPHPPADKLVKAAPAAPLLRVPQPSSNIFDYLYDATAALARIQQMSVLEISGALSDELERKRFLLAARQFSDFAEMLTSIAEHSARVAEIQKS